MAQNDTLTGTFALTNRFDRPLEVKDVFSGCGCVATDISLRRLAPGESATLTLAWRVGTRRGPARERAIVQFMLDGELDPRLSDHLSITCNVAPTVVHTPERVEPAGSPVTIRFRLATGGPVRVLEVQPDSPHLVAVMTGAGRDGVAVSVRPGETLPLGAGVRVRTDCPAEPWVTVPVGGGGDRPGAAF